MLFNLESDSMYESEMIKVKSEELTICLSLKKIRNAFFQSKMCQLDIVYSI